MLRINASPTLVAEVEAAVMPASEIILKIGSTRKRGSRLLVYFSYLSSCMTALQHLQHTGLYKLYI